MYLRWGEVFYNPPESMVVWVIFWLNNSTFLPTLACTNLRPDSRARSLSAGGCTSLIRRLRLQPLSCFVAHESSIVSVVMVRANAVVAGPGGRLRVVWPFGHSRHKQLKPMSAERAKWKLGSFLLNHCTSVWTFSAVSTNSGNLCPPFPAGHHMSLLCLAALQLPVSQRLPAWNSRNVVG